MRNHFREYGTENLHFLSPGWSDVKANPPFIQPRKATHALTQSCNIYMLGIDHRIIGTY